jgi:urease accessory protein
MNTDSRTALLRLMQLVSPSLPVGGFTYSQGIEWAAEAGWIANVEDLETWLSDLLCHSLARLDVPVLARLYRACEQGDRAQLQQWTDYLVACRETAELRAEEANRGRALADLLASLAVSQAAEWRATLVKAQVAGFALAAVQWSVPLQETALGYIWSWLENMVLAAVKIIPLGQTAGQQLLQRLIVGVPAAVETGLVLDDRQLGACSPALAIASSQHETQYTRLYRS